MGKDKKDKDKNKDKDTVTVIDKDKDSVALPDTPAVSYEERCRSVSLIALPLASKKLAKKVYKSVKRAAKVRAVKRGVKEVIKGLRKGAKGCVVLAGDISPIDVISHIPVLCEEHSVPYVYTPSKQDLGAASNTKRPTSCVMVVDPTTLKPAKDKKDSNKEAVGEYTESFGELQNELKELNERMITVV
ncbi:snoRNA-binding protein [Entophlyctis sp. JEL0112]|nr:snoRNA-binding protein [Entophlyctis sp. JEL0112]